MDWNDSRITSYYDHVTDKSPGKNLFSFGLLKTVHLSINQSGMDGLKIKSSSALDARNCCEHREAANKMGGNERRERWVPGDECDHGRRFPSSVTWWQKNYDLYSRSRVRVKMCIPCKSLGQPEFWSLAWDYKCIFQSEFPRIKKQSDDGRSSKAPPAYMFALQEQQEYLARHLFIWFLFLNHRKLKISYWEFQVLRKYAKHSTC